MVWSIDTDDFWGFCTGTKFGLTHTIAEVINEDLVIIDERFRRFQVFRLIIFFEGAEWG